MIFIHKDTLEQRLHAEFAVGQTAALSRRMVDDWARKPQTQTGIGPDNGHLPEIDQAKV